MFYEYVSSIHSKPCLNFSRLKFIRVCRCLTIRGCKSWLGGPSSKRSGHGTFRLETRGTEWEQWQRIEGRKAVAKEVEQNANNGKHQNSFEEHTTVVSATMRLREENYHQSRFLLVNRKSQMPKSSSETASKAVPRRPSGQVHSRMSHLQETSGSRFGENCVFKHHQVEGQPDKQPRKNGDNTTVALLINSIQLGCVLRISSRRDEFCGRERTS